MHLAHHRRGRARGGAAVHITWLIAAVTVCFLVPMPAILGYRLDACAVLDLVEQHRPTFTATAITALIDDPTVAGRDLSWLGTCRCADRPVPGGALDRQVGTYISNVNGLTATTSPPHAVPTHLRAPVDPTSGALSVGVPIFETAVRVGQDQINASGHRGVAPPGGGRALRAPRSARAAVIAVPDEYPSTTVGR